MYFKLFYNAYIHVDIDTTAAEDAQYAVHLQELQQELEESTPRSGKVGLLMKKTFRGRRKWICEQCPQVGEVVEVFPCLKRSSRVRPK